MADENLPTKEPDEHCNGITSRRTYCKQRAGARTDHLGFGRCWRHSGASQNGKRAAARQQIRQMALDAPEIHPDTVLDGTIRRAWAELLWIEHRMDQADLEDPSGIQSAALWEKNYGEWLDRAGKLAKLALDAGVEERKVRLAEDQGQLIAAAFRILLDGLNLTPAQRKLAPQLTRSALLALDVG